MLNALLEERKNQIYDCSITQSGHVKHTNLEPVVEVMDREDNKTVYCHVTPEKAIEILQRHVAKGEIIMEYTIQQEK